VYPDDAVDAESLVVYADLAMYRAKQNGRNDFQFYTSNLNFIAHQWLEMEHGIRQALTENQFFLAYQPQIENLTGRIVGMEALLRWRHPERGMIPPLEFIKIAEQSSLINDVGEFVVEACCWQIREWLDQNLYVPRVSINISPRHLRSDKLSKLLESVTQKYAISPELLCLEITENALLDESEIIKKNMRLIKDMGLAISLDDFGMGHSSLLYLKRWAVDEVKIDRVFVDGLVNSEDDRAIVRAIVALAQALGLNLVGEGVENPEQVDVLATCGCTVLQGYYFAHPMSALEMGQQLSA
jgi:EAL domain-containing protein (putative c-di-GMP-specific phosphodiesterase class I)